MRTFVRACLAKPVSDDDLETAICWNVVVPAQIRAGLAAREIDDDDVLRSLEMPLLVTHGREDSVVLPAMAEHVLATCPTAEASWYEGVGHAPHLEEPERFNRELAAADPTRQDVNGVGTRKSRRSAEDAHALPNRGPAALASIEGEGLPGSSVSPTEVRWERDPF